VFARGCSVKATQKRLGHQSAMETLDTYGHLWPDSDDQTREAVDNIFGGLLAQADARPTATVARKKHRRLREA
jgi:hypothetical protein